MEIFCAVETYFRHVTNCAHRNIDSQKMVSELLRNSSVLCNFNKLRNMTTEIVNKEIAFNLLEQLVLLYIRVHTFSWVKSRNDLGNLSTTITLLLFLVVAILCFYLYIIQSNLLVSSVGRIISYFVK